MQYKPMCFKKTVAASGTAERLTTSNLAVVYVSIQAFDDNTNGIFIGDSQVDKTLFNGIELNGREAVTFGAIQPGMGMDLISLKDIWIDADTTSDGVTVICLVPIT